MKDSKGNEIKTGDILFYTERPYDNYADSLVEIYEKDGKQMVRSVVGNNFGVYKYYISNSDIDLELRYYGYALVCTPTDTAKDLTIIPNMSSNQITVEYANEHYPLDAES